MLPVRTMSLPGSDFRARTLSSGSSAITVEFAHSGLVIVDDTTYLATLFR
jgi:hypothetical protein